MEAVKSFNAELSSLYEVKPPISKAKMTALTRGAIKAIKFYKHVVQSVEKFILKCKPEYKVPGLYVIDSIVRQSRHQFGSEKDVFAPRFSKNLLQTFINLFKCPVEDKSKIIRVLNLWQKNQVFLPEIIQPLFDLADPNNPIYQQLQQQNTPVQPANGSQQQQIKGSPALQRTPTKNSLNQSSTSEVSSAPNLNLPEPSVFQQLQQLQRFFQQEADSRPEVHFDRKLLDFDYGDDEDEVNPSPRAPLSTATSSADPVASLLKVPEVLRKLQTLQNTLAAGVNTSTMESDLDRQRKLQEMKMQEDEFDKHLAQTVPNLPFAAECDFKITQNNMMSNLHFMPPPPEPQIGQGFEMMPRENNVIFNNNNKNNNNNNNSQNDVEVITLDHEDSYSDEDRYKRKRSRSRSRDRGRDKDRRRRSRSRSRSRRRHRSKSRERKDKDKKEKERESEKDKERKRRGLPVMRNNHLSVCSTTLWVGHLSKLVHQDDLSNTFGEFGDVVSIDLIIPRGCAFIVMHRRQDATRCLAKLRNHNLHGKCITLAWAPGKGVKGKDLKDYWEGDLGVSYIPWSKVKEDIDLEALEDGGMIDEDTMPEWMKMKVEQNIQKKIPDAPTLVINRDGSNQSIDTSQPPPLPPTSLLQSQMLSMVNPFQLNNRFLGMLPNLPLGVPPPNMAPPPNMLQNLGLGIGSPFQNAAGFMPPQLPQPPQQQQQQEMKHSPPLADSKLRNLSESLMSLAGQPLTMPPQLPLNHPPPPLHSLMDDNMDVDMEDAVSLDLNKPPPLIPLSEQLQSSMNIMSNFNRDNRHGDNNHRFSPDNNIRHERRDRSNDRGGGGRRRSRSRERGRGGDRRDRDRDFGRGGRDRGDRRNFERWNSDNRRDDRHNNKNGRGRDRSYERKQGNTRRDSNSKDGNEQREKSLNDRLREMAGHKFDYSEGGGGENNKISPSADSKNETAQIPPEGVEDSSVAPTLEDKTDEFSSSQDIEECSENRNAAAAAADDEEQEEDNMMFPNPPPLEEEVPNFDMMRVERFRHDDGNFPPPNEGGPYGHFVGFDDERHFNNRDEFEDDIPGGGFNHRFDGRPYPPDFRDELQFGDDGFGPPPLPPPSLLLDGPPGYPDFGPDRFMRNGRRGGRGGRGGRDGPEFFPRDEFIPPMMDDGGGFGPPLRNDFVPPPLRDDFNQRGGIRIRGRAFFAPRGNSFRDSPPGFNRDFDGAPPPPPLDFFRGGGGGGGSGRGRNFMDFRGRGGGRGGGFRSNNNRNRSEFFDGPPAPTDFFDGPPGVPPVLDELLSLPSSVGGSSEEFVDARRENRKRNSRSRWENEEDSNNKETVAAVAAAAPVVAASADSEEVNNEDAAAAAAAAEEVENDGGDATPLRDEIDDCDGGAGVEGEFPLAEAVPAASAAPVVAEISQNSTENDGIIVQNENIVSEQQQQNNNNGNNDETAEELK